jgi:hypothetical protein
VAPVFFWWFNVLILSSFSVCMNHRRYTKMHTRQDLLSAGGLWRCKEGNVQWWWLDDKLNEQWMIEASTDETTYIIVLHSQGSLVDSLFWKNGLLITDLLKASIVMMIFYDSSKPCRRWSRIRKCCFIHGYWLAWDEPYSFFQKETSSWLLDIKNFVLVSVYGRGRIFWPLLIFTFKLASGNQGKLMAK